MSAPATGAGAPHDRIEAGVARRAALAILVALACGLSLAACDIVEIAGGDEPLSHDTLRIMTYNVFHDGQNLDHGVPSWTDRRDRIVDLIATRAPHVLGLQEAEIWQVDWLLERLPEYDAVALGTYADPARTDDETVAVLYRQGELRLEESGHFWYSETPDQPGSFGDESFGRLTRPRMATWVRLRLKGADASTGFYVFNTHLAANGTAADPELTRTKSAELLVRRIANRSVADAFFFLIGDLNATPGDWPLRYLLGSRCTSQGDCEDEPELRMIDAWSSRHPGGDAGTRCNAVTGSDGPRVDYVLAWDPGPDVTRVLDAEIVRDGAGCPSDHRPVTATVELPPDPS